MMNELTVQEVYSVLKNVQEQLYDVQIKLAHNLHNKEDYINANVLEIDDNLQQFYLTQWSKLFSDDTVVIKDLHKVSNELYQLQKQLHDLL